ncbi:MAG: HAD family hydrolase [Gammaproteobacteria bacterium]|nr:HAD family hydrolase [Gammaproteobacteria bacterium]
MLDGFNLDHLRSLHTPEYNNVCHTFHFLKFYKKTCQAFYTFFKIISILLNGYEKVYDIYLAELITKTMLFPGVIEVLTHLNQINKSWGIVTTKKKDFVQKIMGEFPILKTDYLVCADDVKHKKPDPEGLLLAAGKLGIKNLGTIVYVGDLQSDITAEKAATMSSACATYGYCNIADAMTWDADYYLDNITNLLSK